MYRFDLISQSKVDFDDYPISKNTYSTNNILQLVKIQFKESDLGLILTNNHLFWHPNYDYERTRQFSILSEATKEFSKDCDFPIINGGGNYNTLIIISVKLIVLFNRF
jgi:RNA exonuclease NGL2